MGLYVMLEINDDRIGTIAVTRTTCIGEQSDSVNTYRWQYVRDDGSAVGFVQHRFGDGAVALASKVLAEIAERHRIAGALMGHDDA